MRSTAAVPVVSCLLVAQPVPTKVMATIIVAVDSLKGVSVDWRAIVIVGVLIS